MLSSLFKTKPVIDEASKEWIFDTFYWCVKQLDGDFFKENSKLILPSNHFYPGSSASVEEMAETIFTNTLKYAGMENWPIKLVPSLAFSPKKMPRLSFQSRLRGNNCKFKTADNNVSYKINNEAIPPTEPTIDIPFHESQLNQPQDLIAFQVQNLASILVAQQESMAPGGEETHPQTIDLVACFMGFGVIFANTAYQFKGGCGSCNNRNLNRQSALSELETVYALALFSVLKGEDTKAIKKALKSHLYKPFRQAYKEISIYLQQSEKSDHEHSSLSKLTENLTK